MKLKSSTDHSPAPIEVDLCRVVVRRLPLRPFTVLDLEVSALDGSDVAEALYALNLTRVDRERLAIDGNPSLTAGKPGRGPSDERERMSSSSRRASSSAEGLQLGGRFLLLHPSEPVSRARKDKVSG
jgi:hypothetical protein